MRMREATNDYNGSRRILVRFPKFADAVAADFEQRPRAQATLSPGRNTTPNGSKVRRICRATAGTGARRSVSRSSIALPLTEAADASFATDQPSKARAEQHWVADIAALAISGRALKNARGDTPIAKTLDCDLSLVARDPADLRATGHASEDRETQCLGGRLRIRRDRNIDEISHLDLPLKCCQQNPHEWAATGTLLATRRDRSGDTSR